MLTNAYFTIRNLYLLCLTSIAIGLSLSKVMISMGEIGLFLVWIVDGDLKKKLVAYYKNKPALILSCIYILTLLGLSYTSNFDYAIGDIRRKIPLFLLPFCIAGFDGITKKEFSFIFKIYIIGVLLSIFWSIFVMLGGLNITVVDYRNLSRFNSHIRFGLEICLAIFGSVYYFIKERNRRDKVIWLVITLWLMASLFMLSLFTGIIILFVVTVFISIVYLLNLSNKKMKYTASLLVISFITIGCYFLYSTVNEFYAYENVIPIKTIATTQQGEIYQHTSKEGYTGIKENGYLVYKNIAFKELETAWNSRSTIPFDAKDLKGQDIMHTLIRFITSKGKRKNEAAVVALSNKEIKAIEKGLANYKYIEMNKVKRRVYETIWEYERYLQGKDTNGHSVMMRWVYWKTAYHIFKQHPLLGVGTGDLQDAFNKQYNIDQSKLLPKYRFRAHNQYITYAISFGVIGLVIFLFCLFYPMINLNMYKNYTYLAFFSIMILSMITEDTLETQVGITLFAFFNTLFVLKEQYD